MEYYVGVTVKRLDGLLDKVPLYERIHGSSPRVAVQGVHLFMFQEHGNIS